MAWKNLQEDILEDFASFNAPNHEREWAWWAGHEDRSRRAVESEILGLDEVLGNLREEMLSPAATRGLTVQELADRKAEFERLAGEVEAQVRRQHQKKINTSARASRSFYLRTRSDPEAYPKHLSKKRDARWAKSHQGQLSLLEEE
jgi:hypothetical protein